MESRPLNGGGSDKNNFSSVKYQSLEINNASNDTHNDSDSGHMDMESKCTVFETSLNLAKVITGSGMLSLPFAIASTGWLSLGVLVGLGMIFSYAFDLLVSAIEAYKRRPGHTEGETVNYVTLGRHCFGHHGDTLVLCIFSTELVLALMSFFMNIAINMEVLSPHISYEAGVIVACVFNIFLCSFELKLAAYASAIGSFMIGFVLVALIWCGEEMEHERAEYLMREYSFFHGSGLPLSAGLIAFCFGGHSTFPKLYAAMQEPQRYREVIWNALSGVIVLYVTFASVGYAAYAQYTKAPVTLNIGRDTQDHMFPDGVFLRYTAAIGVVCNLLVTCPLVTLPVTDTLNLLYHSTTSSTDNTTLEVQRGSEGSIANTRGSGNEAVLAQRTATVTTSAGISIVAALLALSLGKSQFAPACGLIGAVASFSDSLLLPVFFYHSLVEGDIVIEDDTDNNNTTTGSNNSTYNSTNNDTNNIYNSSNNTLNNSANKSTTVVSHNNTNKRRRHSVSVCVGHSVITLIGVACFISGICSTVCRNMVGGGATHHTHDHNTAGFCDYFNG